MKLYIFSYWDEPSQQTSVNRIRYFKEVLKEKNFEVKVISCFPSGEKITGIMRFSAWLMRNKFFLFYKVVYFLYLVFTKRDIYDFFAAFKKKEEDGEYFFTKNDIIITTAPPYSCLDIGNYLKNKYGLTWIIDYRDPWTLGYPTLGYSEKAYKIRRLFQRNKELEFLHNADLITTVSHSLKKDFPQDFHDKIFIIPNGANTNEIEFDKIESHPSSFNIVYSGTMHDQQLENQVFFEQLKKFIVNQNILPKQLKVFFIGSLENNKLINIINHFQLQEYVHVTLRTNLNSVYQYMYQASLFLHLKYEGRNQIITSKQYDYLAMQKKIWMPLSDHGDLEKSIKENYAGIINYNEEDVYETLVREYDAWLLGNDARIYRSESFIHKISRTHQSHVLYDLILAKVIRERVKNSYPESEFMQSS